jgi:presenilin-like A22 family membrane protease
MNVKYEKYIPIVGMAFMLLLVQLIAVALIDPMDKNNFKAFEDPQDKGNVIVWFAIILIFTGFIFLVIKLNKKWMIQAIILISVGWTLYYIFYALFSVFLPHGINLALTIILSVGLTVLLYKFPEWYVIDITGVILAAGSATIFGLSLDIVPTLLLLVALLVYDYIAVYQTKHMVALAEGVMDLRLPILLVIPKHWNYSFRSEKFDKKDREAFFMGLGDAVMPTLLVVSANFFVNVKDEFLYPFPLIGNMNLPAIGAILGTFLGFSVLMALVMKGKPQAGLPFLNCGVILGYVAGSLIAGSSIL